MKTMYMFHRFNYFLRYHIYICIQIVVIVIRFSFLFILLAYTLIIIIQYLIKNINFNKNVSSDIFSPCHVMT